MSWKAKPSASEKNPRPASRSTGLTEGKAIATPASTETKTSVHPASLLITVAKLGVCVRANQWRSDHRSSLASAHPRSTTTRATPIRGSARSRLSPIRCADSATSSVQPEPTRIRYGRITSPSRAVPPP